jgi:hypothetical protein
VSRQTSACLLLSALTAGLCSSQEIQPAARPEHYIAIRIPDSVSSERVFIRYILAGEQLGGWVETRAGVSTYIIDTTREGQSASRIKAVLYAPGCSIQTFDIPLSNSNNPRYSFVCLSLPNVWITGKLIQSDRLTGREVKLQARYIARWTQAFLGTDPLIPLTIPVGDLAFLSADHGFRISVPDLARDPVAAAPDHSGELQIWAKDKATGDDVSKLTPQLPQSLRTRMGGLQIRSEYPPDTVFVPCAVGGPPLVLLNREKFSIREFGDPCDR